jgi:hypothetical protein
MLKQFAFLLLTALLTLNGFAQRPEWEKRPISYLQLPAMPVSPMANKYQLTVFLDSDNRAANMYQQRQQLLQSINTTNAMLAQQGQMTQPIPMDNNYYPVPRDAQAIQAALQLNGCQWENTAPQFKVNVNVSGFYPISQQLRTEEYRNANGTLSFRYYFMVSYSYKISYQVLDGKGNMAREGVINGSDAPQYKSTMAFPNQYELESWWSFPNNRNGFYMVCDNEAYQNIIPRAVYQLNSELGFTVINDKLEVANFKSDAYGDLQSAFGNATMGYNLLVSDKAKAMDYIFQAIQAWESAVAEFDADNKGRISEHMVVSLYVNLVLGYCYTENWNKANFYIAKLESLQKEEYKKKIAESVAIERDYERRAIANSMQ